MRDDPKICISNAYVRRWVAKCAHYIHSLKNELNTSMQTAQIAKDELHAERATAARVQADMQRVIDVQLREIELLRRRPVSSM